MGIFVNNLAQLLVGIAVTCFSSAIMLLIRKKRLGRIRISDKTEIRTSKKCAVKISREIDTFVDRFNTRELERKIARNITLSDKGEEESGIGTLLPVYGTGIYTGIAAAFKDNSEALFSDNNENVIYRDDRCSISASQISDNWNSIVFEKDGKKLSFTKKGDSTESEYGLWEDLYPELAGDFTGYGGVSEDKLFPIDYSQIMKNNLPENNKDRFIYKDEEVVLGSLHNPDQWEEVEFRKTEKGISFHLKKK